MATIKANGGAASASLCRNGKILEALGPSGGYHHTQDRELADWAFHKCQPAGDFETMLRIRGWFRAANEKQVTASTTVAAHWHRAAKHARRLRRRS